MKSSFYSRILFAALALTLATSAFAGSDSHKSNFQIFTPAQVNGTEIPAGDYTAKWEGSGPTVQLSITQGKKVLVTVPAQVVALSQPAADTQAETTNANGGRKLTSLQFAGKKFALQLGGESAGMTTKTDSVN